MRQHPVGLKTCERCYQGASLQRRGIKHKRTLLDLHENPDRIEAEACFNETFAEVSHVLGLTVPPGRVGR